MPELLRSDGEAGECAFHGRFRIGCRRGESGAIRKNRPSWHAVDQSVFPAVAWFVVAAVYDRRFFRGRRS